MLLGWLYSKIVSPFACSFEQEEERIEGSWLGGLSFINSASKAPQLDART